MIHIHDTYLQLCASFTKQYDLMSVITFTGKVTADLMESNDSLPPGL